MEIINKILLCFRKVQTFSLLLLIIFSVSPVLSAALRKVLILDFKNIEQKKRYQYLEVSITDAVKKALKQKFAFSSYTRKNWHELAQTNKFIFENDFHTKTVALQLGLLGHQDVVIGGGYIVRGKEIITKVHIIDVSQTRMVAEFEIKGYADARIWNSINKITGRITNEAKTILPNKHEWQKKGLPLEDEAPLLNQITFSGGVSILSAPQAFSGNFSNQSELFPKDIKQAVFLDLEYMSNSNYGKIE